MFFGANINIFFLILVKCFFTEFYLKCDQLSGQFDSDGDHISTDALAEAMIVAEKSMNQLFEKSGSSKYHKFSCSIKKISRTSFSVRNLTAVKPYQSSFGIGFFTYVFTMCLGKHWEFDITLKDEHTQMRNGCALITFILECTKREVPVSEQSMLIDIEKQLKDLEFSMKNMKEIVRIFYVSVDDILGKPDLKKIDHVMKDIEQYLIDFTNS